MKKEKDVCDYLERWLKAGGQTRKRKMPPGVDERENAQPVISLSNLKDSNGDNGLTGEFARPFDSYDWERTRSRARSRKGNIMLSVCETDGRKEKEKGGRLLYSKS